MDATWTPTVTWFLDNSEPLPTDVSARTRLLILDTVACAVGGTRHDQVSRLAASFTRVCPGAFAFPGQPSPCAPAESAALFTTAACWDEFCEGHEQARGRPGLHSVGLPLTLARGQGARVGDVLKAVALGYEVGARFGAALHTREGFHVDGVWGTAAAAASASSILGLPAAQIVQAIGIAATTMHASQYLSVSAGATARNTYAARGVSDGLACALAAGSGITAPAGATATAIALLGRPDSSLAITQIAAPSDFLLLDGYLKRWPGVRHAHYALVAALELRERIGRVPDNHITLTMHPAAVEYAGVRAPATRLQAQFSSTYAAAYALLTGTFDLTAFEPGAVADPTIRALEHRIDLAAGTGTRGRFAQIAADGQVVVVDSIAGDPGRPISAAQTRAKALHLMAPRLGDEAAAEIADWLLTADPQAPWDMPGRLLPPD